MFVLEGRLGGEWVQELLSVAHDLRPGTNIIFDIEDVLFVDRLGEKALLWLSHLGARFVARNAYGVDLCKRLHLRRCTGELSAANGEVRKPGCVGASGDSSRPSPVIPSDAGAGAGNAAHEIRSSAPQDKPQRVHRTADEW